MQSENHDQNTNREQQASQSKINAEMEKLRAITKEIERERWKRDAVMWIGVALVFLASWGLAYLWLHSVGLSVILALLVYFFRWSYGSVSYLGRQIELLHEDLRTLMRHSGIEPTDEIPADAFPWPNGR